MTESPGKTDRGLRALAQEIGDAEVDQWTFIDWADFCILAGIGRDKRTAESWLRVAIATKLMAKKAGRIGPPIFTKGRKWAHYADGHEISEGVKP